MGDEVLFVGMGGVRKVENDLLQREGKKKKKQADMGWVVREERRGE